MNNIRKLGSRFDNPLVNGACSHFFAINSSTSDFLKTKSTRQMTLIPLSIKKWIRLKCRNCRDMLELGVVQWQLILFPIRFTCFVTPLMLSKFRLSSRTLGCFGILVLEPCLVTMNTYFCISRNISPFSTGTASNTLR